VESLNNCRVKENPRRLAVVHQTAKSVALITVIAAIEIAWALYAAETSANLLLFYVVLIVLSAIFFVPGLVELDGDDYEEEEEGPASLGGGLEGRPRRDSGGRPRPT
jgi:hypothetical protein